MDVRKIVVLVEEEEAARTALKWALQNLIRCGDLITLLHIFPSSSSSSSSSKSKTKTKSRLLRLKGFQLALSFKDIICNNFPNVVLQTNIEIVVTEGDQEGAKISAMVREIGASALVVGLHDQSFLYKLAMTDGNNIGSRLDCRVLAIKQPTANSTVQTLKTKKSGSAVLQLDSSNHMDFSQIEIASLQVPDISPPKIPYRICPSRSAIIWRSRRRS
ncbi:hypothetical protein I3843_15G104800 [Carya illinoinensis]|uniref:UspA domain-containing protein n=1 Tax=Carya illinoinensis TaxID=32201 RepID=A0A8T1NEV9_CARIL|nr:uncharacterized protein LOC122296435 [Carya illinoinensis]KAG2667295.1 hypothetical protein I3760_15G107200 [Carya illinoinensis]KAG6627403.1 hypothetical protein CIPAW_15G125200 [Carya illinoinensis]KAG6675577.1 hypothetical protein I3842_15G110400 [Carya illinoinensis]KAG7944481.1 hypothetical protein I3843_15G104800 [Carya illinoinensis]